MPKDDPVGKLLTITKPHGNPWATPPGNASRYPISHRWGFPVGLAIGVCLGTVLAYLSVYLFFLFARTLP